MNLKTFAIMWPALNILSILISALVLYLALDIALFALTGIQTDITLIESMAIAAVIAVIRGAFTLKLSTDD